MNTFFSIPLRFVLSSCHYVSNALILIIKKGLASTHLYSPIHFHNTYSLYICKDLMRLESKVLKSSVMVLTLSNCYRHSVCCSITIAICDSQLEEVDSLCQTCDVCYTLIASCKLNLPRSTEQTSLRISSLLLNTVKCFKLYLSILLIKEFFYIFKIFRTDLCCKSINL